MFGALIVPESDYRLEGTTVVLAHRFVVRGYMEEKMCLQDYRMQCPDMVKYHVKPPIRPVSHSKRETFESNNMGL